MSRVTLPAAGPIFSRDTRKWTPPFVFAPDAIALSLARPTCGESERRRALEFVNYVAKSSARSWTCGYALREIDDGELNVTVHRWATGRLRPKVKVRFLLLNQILHSRFDRRIHAAVINTRADFRYCLLCIVSIFSCVPKLYNDIMFVMNKTFMLDDDMP